MNKKTHGKVPLAIRFLELARASMITHPDINKTLRYHAEVLAAGWVESLPQETTTLPES